MRSEDRRRRRRQKMKDFFFIFFAPGCLKVYVLVGLRNGNRSRRVEEQTAGLEVEVRQESKDEFKTGMKRWSSFLFSKVELMIERPEEGMTGGRPEMSSSGRGNERLEQTQPNEGRGFNCWRNLCSASFPRVWWISGRTSSKVHRSGRLQWSCGDGWGREGGREGEVKNHIEKS